MHGRYLCQTASEANKEPNIAPATAADYELMLRFMHTNNVGGFHIDKVLVNMQRGGMSNSSPKRRLQAWGFDLKAMRKNKLPYPLLTLIIKPLNKITQYL